jgi:hypothetical protein
LLLTAGVVAACLTRLHKAGATPGADSLVRVVAMDERSLPACEDLLTTGGCSWRGSIPYTFNGVKYTTCESIAVDLRKALEPFGDRGTQYDLCSSDSDFARTVQECCQVSCGLCESSTQPKPQPKPQPQPKPPPPPPPSPSPPPPPCPPNMGDSNAEFTTKTKKMTCKDFVESPSYCDQPSVAAACPASCGTCRDGSSGPAPAPAPAPKPASSPTGRDKYSKAPKDCMGSKEGKDGWLQEPHCSSLLPFPIPALTLRTLHRLSGPQLLPEQAQRTCVEMERQPGPQSADVGKLPRRQ